MTSFTTVHLTAQQNLRNLIRAVAQNKWALAYADLLALKSLLINEENETTSMISSTHSSLWGAYISSIKDDPVHKVIDKLKKLSKKNIEAQLVKFNSLHDKDLIAPIDQLRAASLADKRTVLRSVQLVGAPVAAAYLGIAPRTLSMFTERHAQVIGAPYARGYCLSIDEVFMIEQNPQWLAGAVSDKDVNNPNQGDGSVFDCLLYVSEEVACAFTDMTPRELGKAVTAGAQASRPYRLSDLEKIRAAKLDTIA
jgi:hypothetical protein